MSLVSRNIIESLCGNYVACDFETTSLNPKDGLPIAIGYVPFSISMTAMTGMPMITIPQTEVFELWYGDVNELNIHKMKGSDSTKDWHKEKNEAFKHYSDFFYQSQAIGFYTAGEVIGDYFKNHNATFLSRHSFDSKWLEAFEPELFSTIHYRNFFDIATGIRAMGFQDKEVYKSLIRDAESTALEIQLSTDFIHVPSSSTYVKHRPLTDCLIDICLMQEMLMYIWEN